jgi:general L-amino acid transport system permease protein
MQDTESTAGKGQQSLSAATPFWLDTGKQKIAWQFLFAVLIIYVMSAAYGNILTALAEINMTPSFRFLKMASHVDVGESLIELSNDSSNLRVLMAGLLNTLSITFLVIAASTFLGLAVALMRLSANWLVQKTALVYIEIIRNVPLLLLLLIWYRAFFLRLPSIREGPLWGLRETAEGQRLVNFSLSNRGISLAWLKPTEHVAPWLVCLAVAFVLAVVLIVYLKRRAFVTGKEQHSILYPLGLFIVLGLLSYAVLPNAALEKDIPVMGRFNISGGLHVSAEWFSLFSGLILYTSAFVAEIFRAGIQGIPRGQVEAARSLGLTHMQAIRLVVVPQAKVVVIPPLTSQFLGVAKNTSLGVAIGFPDLFSLTGTIINQTGRALEMILFAMAVYLTLSVLTSFVMNWYNKQVQLKER